MTNIERLGLSIQAHVEQTGTPWSDEMRAAWDAVADGIETLTKGEVKMTNEQQVNMGLAEAVVQIEDLKQELAEVKAQRNRLFQIAMKFINYDKEDNWDEQRCVEEFQKALNEIITGEL